MIARCVCSTSRRSSLIVSYFLFNHTAHTKIYTLSLHDALPICYTAQMSDPVSPEIDALLREDRSFAPSDAFRDRKSTRLNSSHRCISYAVFCLKKKKIRSKRPSKLHKLEHGARDCRRSSVS